MIVDAIIDAINYPDSYNAREFYYTIMEHGDTWPQFAHPITRAMDGGTNEDVQRELCRYIDVCRYNPELKKGINKLNWLRDGKLSCVRWG